MSARFLGEDIRAAEFRTRQARIAANLAAFATSHAGSAAYRAELEADWLPLILARRDARINAESVTDAAREAPEEMP